MAVNSMSEQSALCLICGWPFACVHCGVELWIVEKGCLSSVQKVKGAIGPLYRVIV